MISKSQNHHRRCKTSDSFLGDLAYNHSPCSTVATAGVEQAEAQCVPASKMCGWYLMVADQFLETDRSLESSGRSFGWTVQSMGS